MSDPAAPPPPRHADRQGRLGPGTGVGYGVAGLLALLGASLAASWAAGLFAREHWQTWAWLSQGAVLNGVVVVSVLWGYKRLGRRGARVERFQRELGYLRTWQGAEGVLRKTGLMRDLNALGVAPLDLSEAYLAGARLEGIDLRGCRLRGADLRGAHLQGALLAGADLWGADLADADLSHAGLQAANLRGASLENATLVKASLGEANLHRANLVNANLEGVSLETTHLDRARFALREPGLPSSAHASIEDWVRERLDGEGRYREPQTGLRVKKTPGKERPGTLMDGEEARGE